MHFLNSKEEHYEQMMGFWLEIYFSNLSHKNEKSVLGMTLNSI